MIGRFGDNVCCLRDSSLFLLLAFDSICMKKHYYIITGTSRGIGEALARRLLRPGNVLICISRTKNPILHSEANAKNLNLRDIELDLANTPRVNEIMRNVFRRIPPKEVEEITLINNAGTIHPIRMVGGPEASDGIVNNLTVNLTAAIQITDHFVRATDSWSCSRKVVNLSTGAATRAVHGWSAYCSAKAGLRMYAQCLALEQDDRANPVKVVAFSPGVVNTEMQTEIRNSDPNSFPELRKFRDYESQGQLLDPYLVAKKLIELLNSPNFGSELEVDVRNML